MKRKSDHTIFVAQADDGQAQLLRSAIAVHGMSLHVLDPQQRFEPQMETLRLGGHTEATLIADLSTCAYQGCAVDGLLARLHKHLPQLRVIATLSDRLSVTEQEVSWLTSLGAAGLFPSMSASRIEETLLPILVAAVDDPDAQFDAERIASMVRALGSDDGVPTAMAAAHNLLAARGTTSADIAQLIATIRSAEGFEVRDRSYRLTKYPACFVGREAADVLVHLTGRSRATAVAIGRLLRLFGEFAHVADEHDFEDGDYFYRFRASTHITASLDLTQVIEAARGSDGFAVRDRSYHGQQFPNCFIGREAVAWLQQHYDLSAPGAVALGQTLLRLHLFRHVVDEHDFIDGGLFYRFN